MFHADVEHVERVLEAVQGSGELLLRGAVGTLEGVSHGVGERLDGVTSSVDASADLDQLFGIGVLRREGGLDSGEARHSLAD